MSIYVTSESTGSGLSIQISGHDIEKKQLFFDIITPIIERHYNTFDSLYEPQDHNLYENREKILNVINNESQVKCLKRELDSIFDKYLYKEKLAVKHENSEPKEGLDYKLLDKISELVPENTEILLKHVVREINGSAKGLSDFVVLFTKYRNDIIQYNKIEYFQRKGCHFLRKI